MYEYEDKLNLELIAGTDEVGRGPLAGPVVAAAVILPKGYRNDLINDSKKLKAKTREELYKQIIEDAISYSITFIDVETIDKLNIKNASKKAMIDSINSLKVKPDHVLIDYEDLGIENSTSITKGDEKSISIAAASILAKVARDKYMEELDKKYPGYGFATNFGYGSAKHRKFIEQNGWTIEHRKTFNPVKTLIKESKNTN